MLLPAASRSGHSLVQADWAGKAAQPLADLDVLHQRLVRKPADSVERSACHEKRLVAGGDAAPTRAQIHQRSDQREQARLPCDAQVKTPPGKVPWRAGQRRCDGRIGSVRQVGICV